MSSSVQKRKGSLYCVGVGIELGAHITPYVSSLIQKADIVFAAGSDGIFERWLEELHPDVHSLQEYYSKGKSRKITYQEMTNAIVQKVREGLVVVAAFYGHPGIFVNPSHKAIEKALTEGFQAKMIPGISADACLYADLGIDPGKFGCQQYEASQFMYYERRIDNSAYLILWQILVVGDKSHSSVSKDKNYLSVLVRLLLENYPLDHQVIIYQAASNVLEQPLIKKCELGQLPDSELTMKSTLVIPPSRKLKRNSYIDAITRNSHISNITT